MYMLQVSSAYIISAFLPVMFPLLQVSVNSQMHNKDIMVAQYTLHIILAQTG